MSATRNPAAVVAVESSRGTMSVMAPPCLVARRACHGSAPAHRLAGWLLQDVALRLLMLWSPSARSGAPLARSLSDPRVDPREPGAGSGGRAERASVRAREGERGEQERHGPRRMRDLRDTLLSFESVSLGCAADLNKLTLFANCGAPTARALRGERTLSKTHTWRPHSLSTATPIGRSTTWRAAGLGREAGNESRRDSRCRSEKRGGATDPRRLSAARRLRERAA